MRTCRVLAVAFLFLLAAAPATQPAPYNEDADAKADIAAAEKRAAAENQRVLLIVGGNWCSWCVRLHGVMASVPEIKTALRNEYQVVSLNIGHEDKNQDVLAKYGIKPSGYPYIAYLDPKTDKLVKQEETGQLEKGSGYDNAVILKHLADNAAVPLDANVVLSDALAKAGAERKRVFLRFGAPWCGWCHKLDDVLNAEGVMEALNADFIVLKVDVDRMTHGKDVQAKYQVSGGIPWYCTLTPDGKVVATSELDKQNVGFPTEPKELDLVAAMLTGVRKAMTVDQARLVNTAFQQGAAKVKAQPATPH